jgi:hypothetical protein
MDAANFCLIVCGRPGPDGGQPLGCWHPDALLIASGCAMHIHRIGDVTVLNDAAGILDSGSCPSMSLFFMTCSPWSIDSGLSAADKAPWRIYVAVRRSAAAPLRARWLSAIAGVAGRNVGNDYDRHRAGGIHS